MYSNSCEYQDNFIIFTNDVIFLWLNAALKTKWIQTEKMKQNFCLFILKCPKINRIDGTQISFWITIISVLIIHLTNSSPNALKVRNTLITRQQCPELLSAA